MPLQMRLGLGGRGNLHTIDLGDPRVRNKTEHLVQGSMNRLFIRLFAASFHCIDSRNQSNERNLLGSMRPGLDLSRNLRLSLYTVYARQVEPVRAMGRLQHNAIVIDCSYLKAFQPVAHPDPLLFAGRRFNERYWLIIPVDYGGQPVSIEFGPGDAHKTHSRAKDSKRPAKK